jgi:hypothetical protein
MKGEMRGHPKRVLDRDLFLALNTIKNAGAIKVAIVVIDNTIGWQRDRAEISLSTFCRDTGLSSLGVRKGIKELAQCRVITVLARGTSANHASEYVLHPYTRWQTVQQSNTVMTGNGRPSKVTQSMTESNTVDDKKLHSTVLLLTPEADCIKKERNSSIKPLKKDESERESVSLNERESGRETFDFRDANHAEGQKDGGHVSLNEENEGDGGNEGQVFDSGDYGETWKNILSNIPESERKKPACGVLKGCSLDSIKNGRMVVRVPIKVWLEMLQRPEWHQWVVDMARVTFEQVEEVEFIPDGGRRK